MSSNAHTNHLSVDSAQLTSSALRIVFAGTPEFALTALAHIHSHQPRNHHVVGVLTQPDRPAGRGMHLQASSVKVFANENAIPTCQPRSLKLEGKYPQDAQDAKKFIENLRPDVIVVAAYGLILPKWVLQISRLGCINIHASLLPRWRGAAPIHRAIEAGDLETGVCIMQMDTDLDTGPILLSESCLIEPLETTATLHKKLSHIGARLLMQSLDTLLTLKPIQQAHEGVTYASKIEKLETWINWGMDSISIERKLRAFSPTPGLQTLLGGETLKIWAAQVCSERDSSDFLSASPCGTIVNVSPMGIDIRTGNGILRVTELQRAGAKRMSSSSFLHGSPLAKGTCFDSPSQALPNSVQSD